MMWKSLHFWRTWGGAAAAAATGSVFTVISCQQETKIDSPRLLAWAKDANIIVHPSIRIARVPDRGAGLLCAAPIAAGSTVVSVPRNRIITADSAEEDTEVGHVIEALRSSGLDDRGAVALWLLYQKQKAVAEQSVITRHRSKRCISNSPALTTTTLPPTTASMRGAALDWTPWAVMLPGAYDLMFHPIMLPAVERDVVLAGTPLLWSVNAMRRNINRQLRAITKTVNNLHPPKILTRWSYSSDLDEQWALAHALVLTRSSLLPSSAPTVVETAPVEDTWTSMPVCVVPVIDFCNHVHPEAATTRVVLKPGSVDLVTNKNLGDGEELTVSYWPTESPLSFEQCLFSFGFVPEGALAADEFAVPNVSVDGMAPDGPMDQRKAIQRLIFIDRDGGGGVTKAHSNMLCINSRNFPEALIDYFAIEVMPFRDLEEISQVYATGAQGRHKHASSVAGTQKAVKAVLKRFEKEAMSRAKMLLKKWIVELNEVEEDLSKLRSLPHLRGLLQYRERVIQAVNFNIDSIVKREKESDS